MKINNNLWIMKTRTGEIWSNISGKSEIATTYEQIKIGGQLLSELRKKNKNDTLIEQLISEYRKTFGENISNEAQVEQLKSNIKIVCGELINFFKDVEFEPNFRFINTLKLHSNTYEEACNYVVNYFKVSDNNYKDDIQEKVKCSEFKNIVGELQNIPNTKTINNRFKLYYGSAGTGKTTKALQETNNLCMVCNSSMLPSDLLEDFNFDNGKAGFHPSQLTKCMEEGKPITLDEINLLPYESLRFLQGILDNKTEITHKGQVIHIKEGFKIIGTMNLSIGGSTFGLPEPLVDRAEDLKEFKLTADQLVGALI